MEEATETGDDDDPFIVLTETKFSSEHSKVAATLHSLKQLPRRGNNAALTPLMRLQMWRSCVHTLSMENLRNLRTKCQVKSAVSLSMKRTFGHFEQPLPMALDLGIPPLQLQQAKQLCQLHFKYTYGSPTTPESLSGPCRRLRYHELNTHKVTKYNGRRHTALHERTVRLSRLVSFHAPSSYEPHAMPHDWPRVWPPYCSLMQVSWPTSCMHPHKRAPIAALRRRVPHPRNCRPSALEVILPLHYHSTPHVPVCAVR